MSSSVRPGLFRLRMLKEKYELIPLVGLVSFACTGAISYTIYSLYQKPDVRVIKSSELPPWERVDPTVPQKLLTTRGKVYERNPQLDALRKEIGSYKT